MRFWRKQPPTIDANVRVIETESYTMEAWPKYRLQKTPFFDANLAPAGYKWSVEIQQEKGKEWAPVKRRTTPITNGHYTFIRPYEVYDLESHFTPHFWDCEEKALEYIAHQVGGTVKEVKLAPTQPTETVTLTPSLPEIPSLSNCPMTVQEFFGEGLKDILDKANVVTQGQLPSGLARAYSSTEMPLDATGAPVSGFHSARQRPRLK